MGKGFQGEGWKPDAWEVRGTGRTKTSWGVANILSRANKLQSVGQIQPLSVFINKVLLGQGHISSFRYYF